MDKVAALKMDMHAGMKSDKPAAFKMDKPAGFHEKLSRNRISMFRRGGSGRPSFVSNASDGSVRVLSTTEEEFMHAAEVGDLAKLRSLLTEHPDLNVDTKDVLGRTALRLAVKNEHLEIVEVLLDYSNIIHIYESVLQAISTGHVQIAEVILKHRRYLEFAKDRKKLGLTDNFYGFESDDSQFSSDLTPLILAAQKNLFEIVQILLLRGDTIPYPHKFNCSCRECGNKAKIDPLRVAMSRLNAFRGLSSEAYVSLSSKDPILTAFQLAAELRHLAHVEKYFMKEYNQLADQLSEYVVKLLDRVRCNEELEFILNKTNKPGPDTYRKLARFKLAIRYNEKKFVAHPSCQQRLVNIWYSQVRKLERSSWGYRILVVILFTFAYPFLAVTYLIAPSSKIGHMLTFPCLKFLAHALFYVMFLGLILVYAFEMQFEARTNNYTLSNLRPFASEKYREMLDVLEEEKDENPGYVYGYDFTMRQIVPTYSQVVMLIWVVGFLLQECQHIHRVGFKAFRRSLYNFLDFGYLTGYFAAFGLIMFSGFKVYMGIYYFESLDVNSAHSNETLTHLYWMNADRKYWDAWDPINLAEGLFSFANVIAFSRLSYILSSNEALGPMHISLARMVKDVFHFLVVFVLVFAAFLMGINNLYWYYSIRDKIEIPFRNETTPAEENFGSVIKTFRTMFWSMFGRGEPTAVKVTPFDNHLTEDIGYLLYGVYNVACVTVLLNMLIAMMARSFELIAEDADVEWKFARSVLYMEYIEPGAVLPVPLNLIKAPKGLLYEVYKIMRKWCRSDEEPGPEADRMANGKGKIKGKDNSAYSESFDSDSASGSTKKKPLRSISMDIDQLGGGRFHLNYQKVIQRVVKRYIFELQREEEVTEDDFEEVKQEISSFRYEILNLLQTGELPIGSPDADMVTRPPVIGGSAKKIDELHMHVMALRSEIQHILPAAAAPGLRKKSKRFANLARQKNVVQSDIPEDEDPIDLDEEEGDEESEQGEEPESFDNNIDRDTSE